MSKRQQFVLATLVLTGGLLLTQIVNADLRYPMALGLSALAYILSAIVLRDDLRGIEWLTLLSLPTLFTMGVSLFYFLLPGRWITRVPVVVLYAIGMYALLLTENIYNVAANRTIALLRAAHSVGFLLSLISYFLVAQTILAFRFPVLVNMLLVAILSFILIFQSLWAIELEQQVSSRAWRISLAITVLLSELAWTLYFWPINLTITALFLTTVFYSVVGMAQQYLVEKLYKKTIIEFFSVVIVVFIIVLLLSRWRGAL